MTAPAALQSFFGSFGMPAYAATSVPDIVTFPYITYTLALGHLIGGESAISAELWMLTDSEAEINAAAEQIGKALGRGGKLLACDGGAVWLKKGSPWCTAVREEQMPTVKRRVLNLSAEFIML